MSYSAATYYVDYVNGSDTARSAVNIDSSTNAEPIEITTAVAHGLITGSVTTIAGHETNTNANGVWKVTYVSSTKFTLNGSAGNGEGANTGTSTSNGGGRWSDAWKTLSTEGASEARLQAGDTIRIAKSEAPSSMGSATWTSGSGTVTLSSAQTLNVTRCESTWTAQNSATCNTSLLRKEGSYAAYTTAPNPTATTTLYSYFATGALDLSSYQKLSFWLKTSADVGANEWNLCLCSDTWGSTPVDTIAIPATKSGAFFHYSVARNGGGNLGSSIQSIALYSGSSAPTNSSTVTFDNIIACTTAGLDLTCLVSKNSAEQGGTEPWWAIKYINGTSIGLEPDDSAYVGATEAVTSYYRKPILTIINPESEDAIQEVTDTGTCTESGGIAYITYSGGWNVSTNLQDGETFYSGSSGDNSGGTGFNTGSNNYIIIEHLSFCHYNYGMTVSCAKSYLNWIQLVGNYTNALYIYTAARSLRGNNIYIVGNIYDTPLLFEPADANNATPDNFIFKNIKIVGVSDSLGYAASIYGSGSFYNVTVGNFGKFIVGYTPTPL